MPLEPVRVRHGNHLPVRRLVRLGYLNVAAREAVHLVLRIPREVRVPARRGCVCRGHGRNVREVARNVCFRVVALGGVSVALDADFQRDSGDVILFGELALAERQEEFLFFRAPEDFLAVLEQDELALSVELVRPVPRHVYPFPAGGSLDPRLVYPVAEVRRGVHGEFLRPLVRLVPRPHAELERADLLLREALREPVRVVCSGDVLGDRFFAEIHVVPDFPVWSRAVKFPPEHYDVLVRLRRCLDWRDEPRAVGRRVY